MASEGAYEGEALSELEAPYTVDAHVASRATHVARLAALALARHAAHHQRAPSLAQRRSLLHLPLVTAAHLIHAASRRACPALRRNRRGDDVCRPHERLISCRLVVCVSLRESGITRRRRRRPREARVRVMH